MRKIFTLITISFFFSVAFGQAQPSELQNISQFIPDGYSVLNETKGNLNLDSTEDMIIVLKRNGEDSLSSIENPLKRKLLILTGQSDKTYKLVAQSDNAVCYYGYDLNFKDAFEEISIQNGTFSINHYGGFTYRWGRTTTFKYVISKNDWFLSNDEYSTFNVTDLDEQGTEKSMNTMYYNNLSFDKFDIYKEGK